MPGEIPEMGVGETSPSAKNIDNMIAEALQGSVLYGIITEDEASSHASDSTSSPATDGLQYELLGNVFGGSRAQLLGRNRTPSPRSE